MATSDEGDDLKAKLWALAPINLIEGINSTNNVTSFIRSDGYISGTTSVMGLGRPTTSITLPLLRRREQPLISIVVPYLAGNTH